VKARIVVPVALVVEVPIEIDLSDDIGASLSQSVDSAINGIPSADLLRLPEQAQKEILAAAQRAASESEQHEHAQAALWVAAHALLDADPILKAHINPWLGICRDVEV
jgi:hypothetical protein